MAESPENISSETSGIRFRDLGLPDEQLEILDSLGFVDPTPIQEQSIPVLLAGRDVVGVAQTGTGKTAAFGLPLLTRIDPENLATQALVLAPTRELALQTTSALKDLVAKDSPIRLVTVYGGSSYTPQLRALREGTQVVVGTPGRIIDLLERGALDLSQVSTLVLDEADEMLRMGFAEEVERIVAEVPEERLTALFSATMPSAIGKVARRHLRDPERVEVSSPASTVDTIRQTYAAIPPKLRFEALCRFLAVSDAGAAIVFVRTRADAEEVSLGLSGRGFRAAGISGDVAQRERERLLDGLRRGALDVLVATDVAARGIDVERVGLVVNYEVPREVEQYVHRIGRTGRAGRSGESLTLFTQKDMRKLRQIERLTGTPVEQVSVPTADQVRAKKTEEVLQAAMAVSQDVSPAVVELLDQQKAAGIRYRDLAAALLAAASSTKSLGEDNDVFQARLDASFADNNRYGKVTGSRQGTRKAKRDFHGQGTRYRIEVGRRDGVTPGAIVGTITGETGMPGTNLGRIDMFQSFTVVEFDHELTTDDLRVLDRATIRGRRLRISPDRGGAPRGKGGGKKHSDDARRFDRGYRDDKDRSGDKSENKSWSRDRDKGWSKDRSSGAGRGYRRSSGSTGKPMRKAGWAKPSTRGKKGHRR